MDASVTVSQAIQTMPTSCSGVLDFLRTVWACPRARLLFPLPKRKVLFSIYGWPRKSVNASGTAACISTILGLHGTPGRGKVSRENLIIVHMPRIHHAVRYFPGKALANSLGSATMALPWQRSLLTSSVSTSSNCSTKSTSAGRKSSSRNMASPLRKCFLFARERRLYSGACGALVRLLET